jgi:hypothetical protein
VTRRIGAIQALATLAVALTGAVFLIGGALAAPKHPAYTTFVSCGYKSARPGTIKPTHFCPAGEVIGAFFRRNVGQPGSLVYYKVCVRFGAGSNLCKGHQPARKLGRRLYVNRIINPGPGRHKVTWFVRGKRVGTWYFRRGR